MFWETLIQPVTGIINKVLDKVAADKISEAEKARLTMEVQRLAVEELQRQEEGFRKFVLEYEGSAKDMPRSIQILRGSVRPILTYVLAGFWVWGYAYLFVTSGLEKERLDLMKEIMGLLFKLNILSLGFWYGERLITRTGLGQMFLARKEKQEVQG